MIAMSSKIRFYPSAWNAIGHPAGMLTREHLIEGMPFQRGLASIGVTHATFVTEPELRHRPWCASCDVPASPYVVLVFEGKRLEYVCADCIGVFMGWKLMFDRRAFEVRWPRP